MKYLTVPFIVGLVGPAVLGWTIGDFVGNSEFGDTVLAAVVPAVVTAAGGIAYAFIIHSGPISDSGTHVETKQIEGTEDGKPKQSKSSNTPISFESFAVASIIVTVFSGAMLLSSNLTFRKITSISSIDAVEAAEQLRIQYLRDIEICSDTQYLLNEQRKERGLETLTFNQICSSIVVGQPFHQQQETQGAPSTSSQ